MQGATLSRQRRLCAVGILHRRCRTGPPLVSDTCNAASGDRVDVLIPRRLLISAKQPATTTACWQWPKAWPAPTETLMRISAPEIGLGICGAILAARFATAQISPPPAKPPDGAALFKQQCATCHTTNLSDPQRQGPTLVDIVGRPAGKVEGFHYSAGFAQADFVW